MRVEPLDPSKHDRANFHCGRASLDEWLAKSAGQAQERHKSSRTFVLTEDGTTLVGYYALASHSAEPEAVSVELAKGQLAGYPIPAVLLAQLAVGEEWQGQGLGERLLADAVRRAVEASSQIGIALFVVDAIDDEAAGFYEHYGFVRWPADGLKLFAKLNDVAVTFST